MPVKTIFLRNLGRKVKLGWHRPTARCPRLFLKNYLTGTKPPPVADYSALAKSALENDYDNGEDGIGDCVIAAGYHALGTLTGNNGKLFIATDDQIIADYTAIGGYDPSAQLVPDDDDPDEMVNPTDCGCDDQQALNYWTETGFQNGTTLVGWLAVDAKSKVEIQTALWLFENIICGFDMPCAWSDVSGDGFVWDVAGAPDEDNGHCVCGVGYDSKGVTIDTWGILGTLTYDATATYAASHSKGGDLSVMILPDQLARAQQMAPHGLAWPQLISDLEAIGANVPSVVRAAIARQ